jgi:serine/threonine-protein kinase HipA
MDAPNEEIQALIALHSGLERQGPGDSAFSRSMLALLPPLPDPPRIADLGCGSGGCALLLAEHFNAPVTAVDLSRDFLDQLAATAQARGLVDRIDIVEGDMGALDWPPASLDLLWSEGAAYNLTFEGALKAWRPLLAPGGCAVISELSWFTQVPPAPAMEFWGAAYPTMQSEPGNAALAEAAGYRVLGIHRLPSTAWWSNYYDPLRARMDALRPTASGIMQQVIADTEREMMLFRDHSDAYGYTFYCLQAV